MIIPPAVRESLLAGERVLWVGKPQTGLLIRPSDALLIPFSLMWGGFAIFWEWMVIQSNAPLVMRLWGIPFVLIGLYLMVGRFFFDSYRRARTQYAVTDRRVLIIEHVFGQHLRSLPLERLSAITLSRHGDGSGTIQFPGTEERTGRGRQLPPQFDHIPDAEKTHRLIEEASTDARRDAGRAMMR
ncbi:PH domain-containing protein [Tahibacter amnicola]|uniref:PH domain-containing protein n=1 Tax=Tahibacter amnicola TaxID=2976241 RepID=A0ABY6B8X9_9GAMM|nr:PH domain-containing protein [Tahibacter amnicola]UXI66330.1 PH domain-containing protein [Tahibacter amnicola]